MDEASLHFIVSSCPTDWPDQQANINHKPLTITILKNKQTNNLNKTAAHFPAMFVAVTVRDF